MESYLLRGVLIGLLFGLPVGAVGTMTVQRTWSLGIRAGLLTGLGSSAPASSREKLEQEAFDIAIKFLGRF